MPSIVDTYVTLLPETSRIAPGVKAAMREIGDQKVTVIADVDTAKAKAQLDETAKERKAPVKADADTARAKEQLDAAARDRHSTIHVDVDKDKLGQSLTTAAEEGISKIGPQAAGAAGTAGSQIGSSMGAALTPVLLGAGITAIAGIASAFSGLAGLLPAGLLGAGGVVGTLALGLDGVKDAWDAAGKAAQSSGKDQTEQAKAVQSAQLGLKTATEDEARAQRDVATARKDATKELRDLNSELRHGALDEKQAELNLQQDIFDLQHGTFQNSIDYQKQQLRVLTDQQDLADAKTRNNDLSQKANTLRQQGVEGNPKVVDAEQRLADSIQKVAAAQQTLTAAFKPSADALAQAQAFAQLSTNAQALVNTLLGMKPAFQGLKFAVQDALFKDLGPQIQQLASSFLPMLQQALVTMASTMNQTFGQLASWLQKPETMSTIQTILNDITAAFQQFQPVIMTVAQSFLQLTSVGAGFLPQLGQLIGQIAQGFQQFINSGDLGAWIKDGITAFQQFIPIGFQVLQFFRALAPIGLAVLPAIQQLFAALMPAVAPLASAFASLITAVAPLLGFIGQLVSTVITAVAPALKTWFDALGPVIKAVAGALGPVLQQLQPILGQVASTLANAMVQGIKTLLPVFIPFVEQAGKLLVAVLPLFPQLVNLAISALPTVQQAIATLLPIMTKWMGYLTDLANLIIPPVTAVVKVLAEACGTQFDHIKTAVTTMWDVVKPIFETMKQIIDDISGPLNKIIGVFVGPDSQALDKLNQARAEHGLPPLGPGGTAGPGGTTLPRTVPGVPAPNGIIPIGPPFTGFPGTGSTGHAENRTSLDIGPSGWGAPPKIVWGGPNAATPWGPQSPASAAMPSSNVLPPGAYAGDQALLANVPAGRYSQDPSRDLLKGLSDCSSSVGDLVNIMDKQATGSGGNLTTGNAAQWLPQHGFLPTNVPVPGAFNVGYNGEHMQATLPGGTNWNYGSDAAAAARGISGGGAFDPTGGGTGPFTSHFYRPVNGGAGSPMSAVSAPTGVPGDPLNIVLDPTVPANQRSDKNGKGGGPNGQQLGQDFVSGIAQIFGIDGSVFPDPMSGGLFQGFKGLMSALTSGNKNGGGSYADRYGSGAAPGGGSGSLPSILQGFIPQAVGDLNPAPGTAGAPGEFMPFQPGSESGGLLAAPMGNQQPPGGPVIDNSINFHGPVGDVPAANQAALDANIPRARQGIRPLPTP